MANNGSVPVAVAAKIYGKDPSWVRAGLISGYLPIGTATRDGKKITEVNQMDSKSGRINYYISPRLLYEHTGVKWKGERLDKEPDAMISDEFITKERFLELKYFCRQYRNWEKLLKLLQAGAPINIDPASIRVPGKIGDPTARTASAIVYYKERINLIKDVVKEVGADLEKIIFEAVTTGRSYKDLSMKYGDISEEAFMKAYKTFFTILNKHRG